jgi:hypothetical protein
VGLERGLRSLESTNEELLRGKSIGSGLEIQNTAVGIRRTDHTTHLFPQNLSLTSQTSGGRPVGIVRSWTKATKLLLLLILFIENDE